MKSLLRSANDEFDSTMRRLWSNGRGWILIAVSGGWALSIGIRFVYPALVPFFEAEFRLGLVSTGLLMTMLWGSYAVGHIPGGMLGDRIGEGNILLVSTVISAATALVVATSVNVWVLFAGTVAIGLATALYGPTRFTILTNIYDEGAGSAVGLTMAAGSVGNAALPIMAAFIATYATWRLGFGVFVPAFLIVAVAIWRIIPGRTSGPDSAVDEVSKDSIRRVLGEITRSAVLLIVVIQVSISFVVQGFSAFYPTYLAAQKSVRPELAAMLFGLFFALGAVVQPVSGVLMDRYGLKRTLVGHLGGSLVGLWLLPFSGGLLQLGVVTALVSNLNGCFVVTQTRLADSLPEDLRGTGLGTLKAGWMVLGATAPLFIGVLADYGYFDEGFLLLAAVGTAGLVLSVLRL